MSMWGGIEELRGQKELIFILQGHASCGAGQSLGGLAGEQATAAVQGREDGGWDQPGCGATGGMASGPVYG